MQIIDITMETVSKDVAQCNAVVLKVNETFRYLFIPKLINNSKDQSKCISGQFIVQKKAKSDDWANYNNLPISKLAMGQWINLDLSTSSMETLISYIESLRELYLKEGKVETFGTTKTILFSNKLSPEEKEIISQIFNKDNDMKKELKEILQQNINLNDVLAAINNGKINIEDINNNLNYQDASNVYCILQAKLINPIFLEENLDNSDERFWQNLFKKHPNIISSIIPSIVYLIEDQPYMGGKAINNIGGSIGDFLFKSNTENVSIIEIKTPNTTLLSREYRNNVYCPSQELIGSIVQIRKQKQNLLTDYNSLKISSIKKNINFNAFDPKTYIIIGNTNNLNSEQIESFELFRNSLKDIEIITFNELIDKLKIIQKHLESK